MNDEELENLSKEQQNFRWAVYFHTNKHKENISLEKLHQLYEDYVINKIPFNLNEIITE